MSTKKDAEAGEQMVVMRAPVNCGPQIAVGEAVYEVVDGLIEVAKEHVKTAMDHGFVPVEEADRAALDKVKLDQAAADQATVNAARAKLASEDETTAAQTAAGNADKHKGKQR